MYIGTPTLFKHTFVLAIFISILAVFSVNGQYTDVINSNRPGMSVSAFAVGHNVAQLEMGLFYEQQEHGLLNTEADVWGTDISLRYGLLFEQLELNYEGTYQQEEVIFTSFDMLDKRIDFRRNRIGLKFLVFDPFKNEEANKPNLYSWRKNNKFQFKNLIPAVSIYGGANFVLGDNPFYPGEAQISPRAMIATQSKITNRMVLITNTAYDRIGTEFPELSYIVSISHAFGNPKWSAFVEHQGIQSDRYADLLLRSGVAYLAGKNLQVDVNFGTSFKYTPSRMFASIGGSYRLDFHVDKPMAIEDQEAGQNGGGIKKGKGKKKKGSGAEDVDLGPNKKQLRQIKKAEKKKNGSI